MKFPMQLDDDAVQLVTMGLLALEEKVRGTRVQIENGVAYARAVEAEDARRQAPPPTPPAAEAGEALQPKQPQGGAPAAQEVEG